MIKNLSLSESVFFNLNGIRNVIIFNTDLAMIAKHVSAGNFYCELVKQNPKWASWRRKLLENWRQVIFVEIVEKSLPNSQMLTLSILDAIPQVMYFLSSTLKSGFLPHLHVVNFHGIKLLSGLARVVIIIQHL